MRVYFGSIYYDLVSVKKTIRQNKVPVTVKFSGVVV